MSLPQRCQRVSCHARPLQHVPLRLMSKSEPRHVTKAPPSQPENSCHVRRHGRTAGTRSSLPRRCATSNHPRRSHQRQGQRKTEFQGQGPLDSGPHHCSLPLLDRLLRNYRFLGGTRWWAQADVGILVGTTRSRARRRVIAATRYAAQFRLGQGRGGRWSQLPRRNQMAGQSELRHRLGV
jgi:hypothetical protein